MSLIAILCGGATLRAKEPIEPFVEVVLDGLSFPSSVNFAPDGTLFILERGNIHIDEQLPPKLKRVDLETLVITEIGGVPEAYLHLTGLEIINGGALGLEIDPNFSENQTLYICYHRRSSQRGEERVENRLSSFELVDGALTNERVLIDGAPGNFQHNGCRVLIGPDDKVYLTTGEAGLGKKAGEPESLAGKVLRVNRDGSIPDDNPFPDSPVWSYGHRNAQGLAFDPHTGDLWLTEHGPSTNDELNVIDKGMYYGWPHCSGEAEIGESFDVDDQGDSQVCNVPAQLEKVYRPAVKSYFPTTAVGISDLAFYQGKAFPRWQGSLLLVTLRTGQLFRLTLDGREVVEEEQLITGGRGGPWGRLRDVTIGPDGFIYVVTNQPDRLLRIRPRRFSDDRPDSLTTLANSVAVRFAEDSVLGDLDIEVTAVSDTVYLSSEETNGAQRLRAVQVARDVPRVRRVVDNTALANSVATRFSEDSVLGGLDIEIIAVSDTVYLSSEETNEVQRLRAVQVARDVPGVRRVVDNTALAINLADRFSEDPVLSDLEIEITAVSDTVYLSSSKNTNGVQRLRAVQVARDVPGVRRVVVEMQ